MLQAPRRLFAPAIAHRSSASVGLRLLGKRPSTYLKCLRLASENDRPSPRNSGAIHPFFGGLGLRLRPCSALFTLAKPILVLVVQTFLKRRTLRQVWRRQAYNEARAICLNVAPPGSHTFDGEIDPHLLNTLKFGAVVFLKCFHNALRLRVLLGLFRGKGARGRHEQQHNCQELTSRRTNHRFRSARIPPEAPRPCASRRRQLVPTHRDRQADVLARRRHSRRRLRESSHDSF